MKNQETGWLIEEPSTGSDTATSGNSPEGAEGPNGPPVDEGWGDSQKNVDTPPIPVQNQCVGEVRLRLFDDETVTVDFVELGRWTPGRLEKAVPRLFRECILARQAFGRKADGLPEHFNTGNEEA